MRPAYTFSDLAPWMRERTENVPPDAATLRIRFVGLPGVSHAVEAGQLGEVGALEALADWVRDTVAAPCTVRLDWLDGSGGYLSGCQRSFALPADVRNAAPSAGPEVDPDGPRPVVEGHAVRLGPLVDVDGVSFPLTAPDGPDPARLLHAAAAAGPLSPGEAAHLTMALHGAQSVAAAREEQRVMLASLLQCQQALREVAVKLADSNVAMSGQLRQALGGRDAMVSEMLGVTIAAERAAGDDRASAASANARLAHVPTVGPDGEPSTVGADTWDVPGIIRELRGAMADVGELANGKQLGADGPTVGAVRKALVDGDPSALVAWASTATPTVRASWMARLAPAMAALAS